MRQLIDAKVEKKETDRERRFIECIGTLKRLYKGKQPAQSFMKFEPFKTFNPRRSWPYD